MLSLRSSPWRGGGLKSGVVSVGVLLVCASADARTVGLAGATTSIALLAVLAALLATPGWPMPLSATAWAYPALALLVGSGVVIAWRSRSRATAADLARWNRSAAPSAEASSKPTDGFDSQSVLAAVKPHFVRLQAAWDVADLQTLRSLTTPAMFEEISGQLALRGPGPNRTDVLTLHAEVLGIERVGSLLLASVQFSGMLREASEHGAVPFRELWMLTFSIDDAPKGWRLARQQALW